ncbi:SDR family NAD(P)-dependent oxidoreductase [Mucilaginibacter gynuensis]
MSTKENIILVTGATGTQGHAVAQALLKSRNAVRIIVRKPSRWSETVLQLEQAGAHTVIADMDDEASLNAAMRDVYGLFSVQAMDDDTGSERRHADNLARAAKKAGVQQVVHVSASRTGDYESFPGWGDGKWNEQYWTDKRYAENVIINAGFNYWTILRPTFFMDNFLPPKAPFMYAGLETGSISVVFKPDKKLQFIDTADTGAFAAAAFNDPEHFNRKFIDLAGDELTIGEIVGEIGKVTGKVINVRYITEQEAINGGMFPALANYQEWTNAAGYVVDIDKLSSYCIPLTSFRAFFEKNKHLLNIK